MPNQYVNKVVASNGTTLIDLTSDTVTSSDHIMQGYVGHLANGRQVVGTGQGGTSATQHVIHFEFTDSTEEDIDVYYDDSFVSDAITATEPTTYDGKIVTLAELDGVAWYQYDPSETWETVFSGTTQLISDTPYPYFWIASLSNIQIHVGSVWKVTMDGVESGRLTATNSSYGGMIGNPLYSGGSDDGSGLKYDFFNAGWGAWSGGADMVAGNHSVKIERLVT